MIEDLGGRVVVDAEVCGGMPRIRGTRLPIAVILDGLAEGFGADELIAEYPQLTREDVRAALAYAAELSRERLWRVAIGS